ncbi:hypothetical protein BJF78_01880 [Pseudonocardia sp. CNS-139]|nr:hypothetical protein BJF78_01880 [Pseudonocardia sp. CNS-139]
MPSPRADVPVVGPVRTPEVTVSPARIAPPAVTVTADDTEIAVDTSAAEVETPDVMLSAAQAGPVALSETAVTVPDAGCPRPGSRSPRTPRPRWRCRRSRCRAPS